MFKLRLFRSLAPILLGFALALSLAAGALALTSQETPLNQSQFAEAYELNPDPQGILWVSDYGAGEVRRVDPADGSYTAYQVGGGPTDARSDGATSLWWVDAQFNQVGRLPLAGGSASLWEVPGSTGLYGTGLGLSGDIWVTDFVQPYLYHLSPSASELCTYTLPLDGTSDYLLVDADEIWLGDYQNAQIDRLNVISDTFTTWSLPTGSRPTGMALDGNGGLWWADTDRGLLASLAPATNQVITYTQSLALTPKMLAISDGLVWFSAQDKVGVLDPAQASGRSTTVQPQTQPATKKCASLAAPITTPIATSTGQAVWAAAVYSPQSSAMGWHIYKLPIGSISQGIAAQGEHIWLVDQGRRVLARFSKKIETQVFLPLVIK
jgi:streptogramin lyase